MPAGEQLKQRATQYAVKFDDQTNLWRILDTYHKGLEALQAHDEIPDDHEAVVVIPMAGMVEVVRMAESLGLLEHMFGGVSEEELNEVQLELNEALTTIVVLQEQLDIERVREFTPIIQTSLEPVAIKAELSEDAQIVSNAIDSITQLASQAQIGKVAGNGRSINS